MENKVQISEEQLAALLDGNVGKKELMRVLGNVRTDSFLRETLMVATRVDNGLALRSKETLPMMQMAAESGENICSLQCEAYILHRRGITSPEEELVNEARQKGWLKSGGTPLYAIGQILVAKGLLISRKYDSTIDDIAEAIARDNDVIVAVDSDKFDPDLPDEEDATNHAVVVTDIDNTADTVSVYDPVLNGHRKIPKDYFLDAWRESECYMVRVLQSQQDYTPHPIRTDNVRVVDDLWDLRDALAENTHDTWVAARIKEGWTYGPIRDDVKKTHPELVPFSALSQESKKHKRDVNITTLKLIKKLGFDINRQSDTN